MSDTEDKCKHGAAESMLDRLRYWQDDDERMSIILTSLRLLIKEVRDLHDRLEAIETKTSVDKQGELNMSEIKHSPLPWKFYEDDLKIISTDKDSSGDVFTIVDLYDSVNSDNLYQNAAFIVRACNNHYELLRECELALAKLENMAKNIVWDHDFSSLREAIAKAKGEQP